MNKFFMRKEANWFQNQGSKLVSKGVTTSMDLANGLWDRYLHKTIPRYFNILNARASRYADEARKAVAASKKFYNLDKIDEAKKTFDKKLMDARNWVDELDDWGSKPFDIMHKLPNGKTVPGVYYSTPTAPSLCAIPSRLRAYANKIKSYIPADVFKK
jgi:hypothetical protein